MSASIDQAANATPVAHESSIHRVSEYPVVKDSLAQAHALVTSNAYSDAIYQRATKLSWQILEQLKPLQKRLPLETVDSYANAGLDFLEKRVPLKTETSQLIQTARKPADDAAGLAKSYADGITSRLSPVTTEFSNRIAQGQETLHALQEKLSSTIASLPRDKQSASDAVHSLIKEVESLSQYVRSNISELPHSAQARAQPLIDEVSKATGHIREEIAKPDTPLSTKASNILSYTQSQITPLFNSIKEVVLKKKDEAVEAVQDVSETATEKTAETTEKVSEATEQVSETTTKASKKASKKVNGSK